MPAQNILAIHYIFEFPDGTNKDFLVQIDKTTASYLSSEKPSSYNWTELEFNKCVHCPLTAATHPQCPIAKNLSTLVDHFKDTISHSKVTIVVETPDRTCSKKGPVQNGLYSIFGLIMATSGCPHMNFLKPMALFHLPLATYEETVVRSTAFYLLGQYFVQKKGGKPDWDLKRFEENYKNVSLVNEGIISRLRAIADMTGDAQRNAIVALDSFGKILEMEIKVDLSGIEPMFLLG